MKSKNKVFSTIICLSILSTSLFSCKKENNGPSVSVPVTSTTTDEIIAKSSLVAWYKFTHGNTADFSGNNNHLTAYNATLATDFMGRPNNAYAFDGFSSFMQAENSNSLNPSEITLAVLMKPTGLYNGTGSQSRIFMKGADDQSNGDYFLGYYNNGRFFGTYGDDQFESNGVTSHPKLLQLNTWYKLVYTYNGSVGKLYLNDSLISHSNQTALFNPNSSPLIVGKTGRDDYPYWFNGVIDEIRIYNTALTPSQVAKMDSELGQQ